MASVDATPFILNTIEQELTASATESPPSPPQLHLAGIRTAAARMIRSATSMREPSMAVRETAAQEIEQRQVEWSYSRPIVFLDAAWNAAFVAVAVVVLFLTAEESPRLPLKAWAIGYALQCLVHVICVCVEYRRRQRRRLQVPDGEGGEIQTDEPSTIIRYLESANTMFSFFWWTIGFYWIFMGGRALQQDSPLLYWLCIAYLVLDLFFVIFCVALASVIAAAVCFCLPCIIGILYFIAERAGASKEDIEILPKYRFHRITGQEKTDEEGQADEEGKTDEGRETDEEGQIPCGGVMRECGTDSPNERTLTAEKADCCICLSAYEDGAELTELPCGHHFHSKCVETWLYINSVCPYCKYDISGFSSRQGEP